jgi:hypothetical protein
MSGVVTAASGGAPLSGVTVQVQQYGGCCNGTSTTTALDGSWSVSVPAGDYTVQFSLTGYATQYWNNTTDQQNALPIGVASGGTVTGINAALAAVGAVSGTVTSAAGGTPLAGVSVYLSAGYASPCCNPVVTAADGTWSTTEPAGSYFVTFTYPGYATQYWQDTTNAQSATPVTVTSGGVVTGINAAMSANGTIGGTVTAAAGGAPLAGVSVSVSQNPGCCSNATAFTGANGTWSATEPPGTYYVTFSLNGYQTQYWNNTTNAQAATPVTVTSGDTVTGINAAMAVDGTISGTVTAAGGGAPVAGVSVFVGPYAGYCCTATAVTGASGTWSATEPPGTYYVTFSRNGYQTQYWNNTTNAQAATPVTVVSGQSTSGINAALVADGTISGTVTAAAGGAPVAGVSVSLQGSTGCCISTTTAANGTWSLVEPPGTYTVYFSVNGYAPQYWKNAQSFTSALPVTLTSGASITGINAALKKDGTVTGNVVSGGGLPLAGASVCVYSSLSPCYSFSSSLTTTAADGTWSATVPPGTYYVSFSLNGYATGYWKNTFNIFRAVAITVKAGAATSGINGVLAKSGAISGKVTGPNGAAMPGATIHVQWPGTGTTFTTATSNNSGNYSVVVPPGHFLVWFSADSYSNVYYPASSTPQGAELVNVAPGQSVTGISASVKWPTGTGPGVPTVTSISPTSGIAAGGTSVTVTGTNLGGAAVDFGSVAGFSVTVNSQGTSLTVISPPESAGKVDVTVTTVAGTSAIVPSDVYTYK